LRYQKLQHVFECCLSALTQPHNRFLPLVYCPADNTLFEVGPKILMFQVCQVAAVFMETRQLVLSQFKPFYCSQWRIE